MQVIIEREVVSAITDFYAVSLMLHPTLDRQTVIDKVNRLYDAVDMLGIMPNAFPKARLKQSWIDAGYREMIAEDFHFAFRVEQLYNGEKTVVVYDACHSLLYHN